MGKKPKGDHFGKSSRQKQILLTTFSSVIALGMHLLLMMNIMHSNVHDVMIFFI